MFTYVLKRVLYFIPTLFIISLFTFSLSKMAPGDPVELRLQGGMQGQTGNLDTKLAGEKAYFEMSDKLGLDKPTFYITLSSAAIPDTLYRIQKKNDRSTIKRLIRKYGNWDEISEYYHALKDLENATYTIERNLGNAENLRLIRDNANVLYLTHEDPRITRLIARMDTAVKVPVDYVVDSQTVTDNSMIALNDDIERVKAAYVAVKQNATPAKNYIPVLSWYGFDNQYHTWLFGDIPWFGKSKDPTKTSLGFFRGDFGESYLDGRPVKSILYEAIKYTMILNIISVFIAYIISIPMGVETAVQKDTTFDRISTTMLFILYSLPSFWIATLCVVFITTPEYGMDLFPTYGVSSSTLADDAGFWTRFKDSAYHFILPVFCLTYGSFAFISRQMRGGMLSVIRQDYIRTAQAKGLDKAKVVWKHAFRNSLIPIITLFANLFPLMISGSVIIEYIFNIPGMGRVSYEAVVARNYPVLYTVFMFSAILTMVGILVSDIMYAVVDPRISFSKKTG
ncbi:MAG: ABC transporter permease [Chitinophagales bacterium]|nr:ABC transporter permease [Chitinophagales bacterium]